jgi:hypothetical protein
MSDSKKESTDGLAKYETTYQDFVVGCRTCACTVDFSRWGRFVSKAPTLQSLRGILIDKSSIGSCSITSSTLKPLLVLCVQRNSVHEIVVLIIPLGYKLKHFPSADLFFCRHLLESLIDWLFSGETKLLGNVQVCCKALNGSPMILENFA